MADHQVSVGGLIQRHCALASKSHMSPSFFAACEACLEFAKMCWNLHEESKGLPRPHEQLESHFSFNRHTAILHFPLCLLMGAEIHSASDDQKQSSEECMPPSVVIQSGCVDFL